MMSQGKADPENFTQDKESTKTYLLEQTLSSQLKAL